MNLTRRKFTAAQKGHGCPVSDFQYDGCRNMHTHRQTQLLEICIVQHYVNQWAGFAASGNLNSAKKPPFYSHLTPLSVWSCLAQRFWFKIILSLVLRLRFLHMIRQSGRHSGSSSLELPSPRTQALRSQQNSASSQARPSSPRHAWPFWRLG